MLKRFNKPLIILPGLVFLIGYISLLSTAPEKANTQLAYFSVGVALYFIISVIDYYFFKYYWRYMFLGIMFLLFLTFIMGEVKFGSSSWLRLGLVVIQPSEFAKIVVIAMLSALLSLDKGSTTQIKKLLKISASVLSVVALVLVQPDLGTALIILCVFAVLMLYAGVSKLYFFGLFSIFGFFSTPLWEILKEYQKRRVLVFLNPALDVLGSGYNVIQSVISVGSGRLLGKGFGMGTQSHLGFLPVYWTDFIFAAFAEEWGFIGVVTLILLYLLLLLTLIYIFNKIEDTFGSLICLGVFIVFTSQFVINVGMNLGIMPVTGIPLSLVSYGGSSLLTSMILLGIVQSIWVHRKD